MNIYVGNLNYKVDEVKLKEAFSNYGVVESASIVVDRETGRSKGFGFIAMPNDDEGQRAIESLNQSEFMGRKMVVNEARPKNK